MKAAVSFLAAGVAFLAGAGLTAQPPGSDAAKGLEWYATTTVSAMAEVRPQVSGPLVRTPVKEGALVRKGDMLAEIDPRPYQLKLDAATARLAAAEARARIAATELKRIEQLVQLKVAAAEEIEPARVAVAAEKANVDAARVAVKAPELDLAYTKLTSPIDGRIERYHVTEGNFAADGKAVATVVVTDPLHVWFEVPEPIIRELRSGQADAPLRATVRVQFEGEKGYPHPARMDLVGLQIAGGQAIRCRAVLPNPKGAFTAGANARVLVTPMAEK
ncbi:MAG TPA: efflux RND transporter periplasmic adaptor subunit [Urbifossiella sp.]|jgi:RND family efflux transporter MFP subunit|nr:efflux RND transporter periplasmic adaptor subunit [Urbifossiella sp.]